MVISQPPGNNPSYYYRVTNAASIALNASRDTLCSICEWHIGKSEMKHMGFFTRIRSTWSGIAL